MLTMVIIDNGGRTPLIYASHNGFADCVKLLIAKGAKPGILKQQTHIATGLLYNNNPPRSPHDRHTLSSQAAAVAPHYKLDINT